MEDRVPFRPFGLTFDEDLLTIIERMVHQRCVQSVKVSKVEGHADDDMVAIGRVLVEFWVGNDLADRAAGLRDGGSLTWSLTFVGVLSLPVPLGILLFWSSIVSLLLSLVLRSMTMAVLGLLCILLFGPVVVWSRNGGFVSLPGSLLGSQVLLVSGGMVSLVGLALRFAVMMSVFGRGSWLSFVDDLGVGGVSFIELLILYERWAGERLVLEMSVPKLRRLYRSISVSAVPFGPSIDI